MNILTILIVKYNWRFWFEIHLFVPITLDWSMKWQIYISRTEWMRFLWANGYMQNSRWIQRLQAAVWINRIDRTTSVHICHYLSDSSLLLMQETLLQSKDYVDLFWATRKWIIADDIDDLVHRTIISQFSHDGVIKWEHFPRFWPFVRGIRRAPVSKASGDAELWCILWSVPEQTAQKTIGPRWSETPSRSLLRHCNG